MKQEHEYQAKEQLEAWAALYERFDVLPVPERLVWMIQADLSEALRRLALLEHKDEPTT